MGCKMKRDCKRQLLNNWEKPFEGSLKDLSLKWPKIGTKQWLLYDDDYDDVDDIIIITIIT
jgi:hypothetical protein